MVAPLTAALVGACSEMRFTLDDHRLVVQLGKNRRERFLFLGNEHCIISSIRVLFALLEFMSYSFLCGY